MKPEQSKNSDHQHTTQQESFTQHTESDADAAWVCPKCHAINRGPVCVTCGFKRNIPKDAGVKSNNPWKKLSIALIAVFVVFLVVSMFNGSFFCLFGHKFEPATCEEPQTCSSCGITNGEALGHEYEKATCTKAAECTRCHHQKGSPLPHNWSPATYTSPKKCTACGKTEGNVKGYYPTLSGKWSTKRTSVGGTNTTPFTFDSKVKNCTKFTMHFQIDEVKSGDPYGKYTVYAKINNKWKKIANFTANDNSEVTKTFEFDDPITFKQLAVVGPYRYSGNYTFYMWVEDFYLQD